MALNDEQTEQFDEAIERIDEVGVAEAISEAVGDLAEHSRPVAEALAEPLASSTDDEGQQQLSEFLSEVKSITDPDLAKAVLESTSGRPFGEFAARLSSVPADRIQPDVREAAIAPLALSVWDAMETDTDRDEINHVLAEMEVLTVGIEVPRDEGFINRLESSLAGPVASEAAARALIRNALEFIPLRRFTRREVDQHFIQALRASFGQSLFEPHASPTARLLVESTADALEGCPTDGLRELLEQPKPLLADDQICLVEVRVAQALRAEGEEVAAPISPDQLVSLGDSTETTEAIALWIRLFEDDGQNVFALVTRWEDSKLPDTVSDAISKFLDKDREEAGSIIEEAVTVMADRDLEVDFLRRIGASRLKNSEIVRLVKICAQEFRSVETGNRALDLWEAADISDTTTRRDLILDVFCRSQGRTGRASMPQLSESGSVIPLRMALPKSYGHDCRSPRRKVRGRSERLV